jgi:hypothetical protein
MTGILDLRYGFGGLVVIMLASGTQDRGFAPDQSRRNFRAKYPQLAFLRKGSKAVCPMSQICGMLKIPKWRKKKSFRQNYRTMLDHSSTFRY